MLRASPLQHGKQANKRRYTKGGTLHPTTREIYRKLKTIQYNQGLSSPHVRTGQDSAISVKCDLGPNATFPACPLVICLAHLLLDAECESQAGDGMRPGLHFPSSSGTNWCEPVSGPAPSAWCCHHTISGRWKRPSKSSVPGRGGPTPKPWRAWRTCTGNKHGNNDDDGPDKKRNKKETDPSTAAVHPPPSLFSFSFH